MKAIELTEPGRFSWIDKEPPGAPPEGCAVVKIHCIGICGTDLHAYEGKQIFFTYPRILGHELGVEIAAIGKNSAGLSVGDRCAVEPYFNCGACIACYAGKSNCCMDIEVLGVHIDGGMQDFLTVPIQKLHKSDTLDYSHLALVETLGIGSHAVDRTELKPGENTLIIGAGPIGLTVLVFALIAEARVTILEINENRRAFCRDVMKVDRFIDAKEAIVPQLEAFNNGDLPTAVIDCTGSAQSMAAAFNYVAHGGRYTMVGTFPGDLTFSDPNFHKRELTLRGSRNATPKDFTRILSLLEEGRIDLAPWITHWATRDALIEQFPTWLNPNAGVLKAVVDWT